MAKTTGIVETATETNAAAVTPAATEPTPERSIDAIGTLTYPRAVRAFGKANALRVMREVAAIGGHGLFEDAEFMSPLFGGLAMPDENAVIKPLETQFVHAPEPEFYYAAALEEYEGAKAKAGSARDVINALYAGVK